MSQSATPQASNTNNNSSAVMGQAKNFLLGGVATTTAVIFTNPMDVLKSRFQVQGELAQATKENTPYKSLTDAFLKISRNEGFGLNGLQKGLFPAMAYQFVMNGMRLGSYSVLNSMVTNEQDHQIVKFGKKLFCGATAGVIGASVGSPLFMIKTRMQIQSNAIAVGEQYVYRNMFHALSDIYRTGGIKSLYTGVSAAALRVAMGSSVQLSTYDTTKQALMNATELPGDAFTIHLMASLVTGVFAVLVMHPFDVISTRLYVQRPGELKKYNSIPDCLVKTLKTEGITGIYKGGLSQYMRLAPHTVLTFVFWEQLKRYF